MVSIIELCETDIHRFQLLDDSKKLIHRVICKIKKLKKKKLSLNNISSFFSFFGFWFFFFFFFPESKRDVYNRVICSCTAGERAMEEKLVRSVQFTCHGQNKRTGMIGQTRKRIQRNPCFSCQPHTSHYGTSPTPYSQVLSFTTFNL